jgi:hypothetical protein
MENKEFTPPKRIKALSEKVIDTEVRLLEQEYMRLLHKEDRNAYEDSLLDYLFSRCNKLWRKIAQRG